MVCTICPTEQYEACGNNINKYPDVAVVTEWKILKVLLELEVVITDEINFVLS